MKRAKVILTFLFFLIISTLFIYGQSNSEYNQSFNGQELSNKVYAKFYQKELDIRTQNLVTAGENSLPYNIIINFEPAEKSRSLSSKQLLLVFDQEQIYNKPEFLINVINYVKAQKYDFRLTILLSYGDYPHITKRGMVNGSSVYLNNSTSNENTTALIFDLDSPANNILTSSSSTASPSFLVKTAYNSFLKNKIDALLPYYYISQQNNFKFFKDRQLDYFFSQEIPAIKIGFTKASHFSQNFLFCVEFINQYNKNPDFLWDQHFIIVKTVNHYINITEHKIVQLIILLFFLIILFIFFLAFVNTSLKNNTWKKIQQIWISVPIVFVLIIFSFFFARLLLSLFFPLLSAAQKVSYLYASQIITAIFSTSIYFIFKINISREKLNEKSIDFLIVFSAALNLFIFSFFDISFFPLMSLILTISIVILIFKFRYIHIVALLILIIPFAPYIRGITQNAQIDLLQEYYCKPNFIWLEESLVLTTIILTYFRILISFKNKLTGYKETIISTASGFVIALFLLILSAHSFNSTYKKRKVISQPLIKEAYRKDFIKTSWTDKKVFNDHIRSLNIELAENVKDIEVTLSTNKESPVLYADNDFEVIKANQAVFVIPENPPSSLNFTYGFESENCIIDILAYKEASTPGEYLLYSQKIEIGNTDE